MTATAERGAGLRALRTQPFALLRELERRSRAALVGATVHEVDAAETVGIGFRLGEERFLAHRNEIREVLMPPASLTRVPGAKPWVRGLANVRGQLLPVMDLKEFLGAGPAGGGRNARILVCGGDFTVGLLVDEVYGFRRFLERELLSEYPPPDIRCERFLSGCYRRGQEHWPVFSMPALLQSPEFQVAAAD